MSVLRFTLTPALIASVSASFVHGDLFTYTDLSAWSAATPDVTTIEFSEFPSGTYITSQYAALGVIFTPGDDYTDFGPNLWPSDGYGLRGGYTGSLVPLPIIMEFSTPITSIGIRFPGGVQFDLFSNNIKIGSTEHFLANNDPWSFAGVISDTPFDRVVIPAMFGNVSMDTLFFGGAIPGPGGFVVLLGGVLTLGGRRRRG